MSGCGESATPPLKTDTATAAGTSPSANGAPATTGVEADTPAIIVASPAATAVESEIPATIVASPTASAVPEVEAPQGAHSTYLLFNQKVLEGLSVDTLDLSDVPLPDNLTPLEDDLLVGRKSGFAFWVDEAHDNRKVLMAISGESNTRNDYYDGPFDQLTDNYVDVTNVSEYMIRWAPSLRDRIDKYGYFTNRDRPSRVSISPYYFYFSDEALMLFSQRTREAEEPTYFISRKGLIPTPTPAPAPTPGSR